MPIENKRFHESLYTATAFFDYTPRHVILYCYIGTFIIIYLYILNTMYCYMYICLDSEQNKIQCYYFMYLYKDGTYRHTLYSFDVFPFRLYHSPFEIYWYRTTAAIQYYYVLYYVRKDILHLNPYYIYRLYRPLYFHYCPLHAYYIWEKCFDNVL